jgi:hypothetical protein
MSNFAQRLRKHVGHLKTTYRVDLEELNTADMYYTEGVAERCDFKLLFSENGVVVAIFYVFPDGEFFGTDSALEAKKSIDTWIKVCRDKN